MGHWFTYLWTAQVAAVSSTDVGTLLWRFNPALLMVDAAKGLHAGDERARFIHSAVPDRVADYGMASGIFNVRLEAGDDDWMQHITNTLDVLNETSERGFAFNCLTSYSDQHLMRDYLFYANPGQLFDLCKRRFSRNVALLHDYDLYEFTILVRKA